jgi:hypothetical protein
VIEALRTAGKAAISAGEQAGTVDLVGTTAGVPGALPGSRSAQAATTLANAWQTRIKGWSTEADAHGRNMNTAADYYAANEEAAKQDLSNVRPHRW